MFGCDDADGVCSSALLAGCRDVEIIERGAEPWACATYLSACIIRFTKVEDEDEVDGGRYRYRRRKSVVMVVVIAATGGGRN